MNKIWSFMKIVGRCVKSVAVISIALYAIGAALSMIVWAVGLMTGNKK